MRSLNDFIAYLQQEQPEANDLDFEQELYNRFGQIKDFTLGMRIGKYFYELGCTRTAEKYDEIEYNRQRTDDCVPNDLEEAAVEYSKEVSDGHNYRDLRVGFIAGAKWQKKQDEKEQADLFTIVALDAAQRAKEQMLKDAEECELYWDGDFLAIDLNMAALGYSERDKVRVIVLPKED